MKHYRPIVCAVCGPTTSPAALNSKDERWPGKWCHRCHVRHLKRGDPRRVGITQGDPERWIDDMLRQPRVDNCILWPFARNNKGYGQLTVSGIRTLAHRVVVARFTSIPGDPSKVAMHLCDNPPCVNPLHLRWATPSENQQDMHNKGRWSRSVENQRGPDGRYVSNEKEYRA